LKVAPFKREKRAWLKGESNTGREPLRHKGSPFDPNKGRGEGSAQTAKKDCEKGKSNRRGEESEPKDPRRKRKSSSTPNETQKVDRSI